MRWRLVLARSLAWALLLSGWVGLAAVAQPYVSSGWQAQGLLAVWLLALGGGAALLARWPGTVVARRATLAVSGAVVATALGVTLTTAPRLSLLLAALAWAALLALASATVRACRLAQTRRPEPPVGPAAFGAVLAWAVLGDIGDVAVLVPRLALGVLTAALLLAALHPALMATASRPACRAGLFDCSMPSWSLYGGAGLPPSLAGLLMLPMMCSLPLMVALCRANGVSARAMLALHFGAMVLPALWVVGRRVAWSAARSQALVLTLLGAGAGALLLAPADVAWLWLALLHGSAWSLAWAQRLGEPAARPGSPAWSPAASAAINAALVLALGFAVDRHGPQALADVHLALGLAGLLAGSAAWLAGRHRARRQNAAFRRDAAAV